MCELTVFAPNKGCYSFFLESETRKNSSPTGSHTPVIRISRSGEQVRPHVRFCVIYTVRISNVKLETSYE